MWTLPLHSIVTLIWISCNISSQYTAFHILRSHCDKSKGEVWTSFSLWCTWRYQVREVQDLFSFLNFKLFSNIFSVFFYCFAFIVIDSSLILTLLYHRQFTRLISDATVEKDESHPGKVLLSSSYCRLYWLDRTYYSFYLRKYDYTILKYYLPLFLINHTVM